MSGRLSGTFAIPSRKKSEKLREDVRSPIPIRTVRSLQPRQVSSDSTVAR